MITSGRWAIRRARLADNSAIQRVRRQFRTLLWLSVGLKVGVLSFAPLYTEPQWGSALLMGFGWVLGEFLLLYTWLYPLEKKARQLDLSKTEYLHLRIGSVSERIAPWVLAGLGLFNALYIMRGGYREDGAWGVLYALFSGLGVLLMGATIGRVRRLPPSHTLAVCEGVQDELRRLAHTLGIPTPELIVVDGRRARRANAFALPGGRIAITDYLVAHLSQRELLAVLAHEVAHLAQRPRLVRFWLLVVGIGVLVSLSLAPISAQLPEWSLLGLMVGLAVLMGLPMLRLRQHHEREADAFAVSEYGAEALRFALIKCAQLNQTQTNRRTDSVHLALEQRLRWLSQFHQV